MPTPGKRLHKQLSSKSANHVTFAPAKFRFPFYRIHFKRISSFPFLELYYNLRSFELLSTSHPRPKKKVIRERDDFPPDEPEIDFENAKYKIIFRLLKPDEKIIEMFDKFSFFEFFV